MTDIWLYYCTGALNGGGGGLDDDHGDDNDDDDDDDDDGHSIMKMPSVLLW